MKNERYKILSSRQKKVFHFLTQGFSARIESIQFCRSLEVATAEGPEAKAEATRSVINEFFDPS